MAEKAVRQELEKEEVESEFIDEGKDGCALAPLSHPSLPQSPKVLILFSSEPRVHFPTSGSTTVLPKWASFLLFSAHRTLHSTRSPPAQDITEAPELSNPQSFL